MKTNASSHTGSLRLSPRAPFRLSLMTVPVAALALVLSAASTFAQKTQTIGGGWTTVALATSFVDALKSLDVTPGVVNPTQLRKGTVDFPVTGGAIDLDTAAGQAVHSGGLTLTAGSTEVVLQSFIIDTLQSPAISGLVSVDGKLLGRMVLFNLTLPKGVTLPLKPHDGRIVLKGVDVTLNSKAASALDSVFKISALKGGISIGTARVILDHLDISQGESEE